ncbi:MAG: PHP domain-containing protein [Firmicutes bacterium]|nr:PHP domain-containing protein [Bacillota bacterium]
MIVLKGQLHIHTTFSDGRLTPQEAADLYSALGFDFIAITDHDHLIKRGYREAIEGIASNMIIFFGVELTLRTRWGYVHVNEIEGVNERLYVFNHPADYRLSVRQCLECLADVEEKYRIDAVEVSHLGFYTPLYDREEIPYPKVATDDSHESLGCGRAWVEIGCGRDKDSILRQIKQGGHRNVFAKG